MNPINFLIEQNYANTSDAAHKILEAASDEFLEFIIQEMTQQEHDSLQRRIANARTPEERQRLKQQLDDKIQKQREKILSKKKPKNKQVIRPYLKRQFQKSRSVNAIKRYLKHTGLGFAGGLLHGMLP